MTEITREAIERLRCGLRCAYVPTYELDAILDAAERSLSEQSRIDAAVETGFRAGIEKAAQWHEYRAAAHSRYATREASGQWTNGPALSEDAHRRYAAAIRALSPVTEEGR